MIEHKEGFIDLRLNQTGDEHNESFWPSFTDIMTVIVMIFMLSMVILLIKNSELLSELQSTLESERQATNEALAIAEKKQLLETELDNALSLVSTLNRNLSQLQSENEQRLLRISQLEGRLTDEIAAHGTEKEQLNLIIGQLTQDKDELGAQLDRIQQEKAEANVQIEQLKTKALTLSDKKQLLEARLAQELSAYNTEKERLDLLVAQINQEKDRLNTLLATSRQETAKANVQIAQLETTTLTLSEKKQLLEAEHKKNLNLISVLNQNITGLKTENEQQKNRISELDAHLAQELSAYNTEKERLDLLVAQINQEKDKLNALLDKSQQQIEKAGTEIVQLKKEHTANLERINELKALSNDQQKELKQHQDAQLKLTQEKTLLSTKIQDLTQAVSALRLEIEGQKELTATEKTTVIDLNKANSELQSQLSKLNEQLAEKDILLKQAKLDASKLQESLSFKNLSIEQLIKLREDTESDLKQLQVEYTALQKKYDGLIRPARTDKDKYVVEIRYSGDEGFYVKSPAKNHGLLSLSKTETVLNGLSKQYCEDLYVRLIFPRGIELAHSKAWNLTMRFLKYDYYHRDDDCP